MSTLQDDISKEYFNSLLDISKGLNSLLRELKYDNEVSNYINQLGIDRNDSSDTFLRKIMCKDILKCIQKLGNQIIDNSHESFAGIFMCYQLLCADYYYTQYSILSNWDSIKMNISSTIQQILNDNKYVISKDVPFYITTIIPDNNSKRGQYIIYLYRFSSIVAKVDNTITDKERNFLEYLSSLTSPINTQLHANGIGMVSRADQVYPENKDNVFQEDYIAKLNSLIGLESVKQQVNTFVNFIRIQQARKQNNLKTTPISYHCVFTGNPGTGKTMVARILASIFKMLGVVKGGQLIETDRSGLVGEYIGSTAIKTNKIIDKALDGVLFIDEAYSLSEGGANDFGKEAISTLIKRMEDDRDRLIVILAGYSSEMDHFFSINPGLQSRFNRTIPFPDYSEQELVEIFKFFAKDYEYTLSEDGLTSLKLAIHHEYAMKGQSFGNARFVRNLFEKTIEKQANRLARVSHITPKLLTTLTEEDIDS